MISRDTGITANTAANLRRARAALCLTTAVAALSIPTMAPASTTISGAFTPGNAQTKINTDNTTVANAVTFDATAVVTPAGTIFMVTAGANGSGAVTVDNLGKIGSINAGGTAVVDTVNLVIDAHTAAGTAGNTAVVTNAGLITGTLDVGAGLAFPSFISTAVTNSGSIWGGINAGSLSGDVTVTTTSTGKLLGGNVTATAQQVAANNTVATVAGVTTTTFAKSGNASIVQDGDAISPGGVRGNLTAASNNGGNASVSVSAKAGTVTSTSAGLKSSVTALQGKVAGTTTTTAQADSLNQLGTSTVTIATTGDVTGIVSTGPGGSTVKNNGKVGTGGIVSTATANDTLSKTAVTDVAGVTTLTVITSSNTRLGGTSDVLVSSTGSVAGGGVSSTSDTKSIVAIDGAVTGNVLSNAATGTNASASSTVAPLIGGASSTVIANTAGVNASTSAITIGATGTVTGGNVTANAYKDASVVNSGKVLGTGNVTVNAALAGSTNTSTATSNVQTTPGNFTNETKTTDIVSLGGTGSFTNNNAAYVGGNVTVTGPAGVTIVNNAGGQVAGTTSGTSTQTTTADAQKTVGTVATSGTVTTTTNLFTQSTGVTQTGASVDGTYAGTNGELNFAPLTAGSVTQTASKASKATVSGTVYGAVNSTAGSGNNTQTDISQSTISSNDTGPPVVTKLDVVNSSTVVTKTTAGGDSTVNVTGGVRTHTPTGTVGNVSSSGNDSSTVTVSGRVDGFASSNGTGTGTSTVKSLAGNVSFSQTNGVTTKASNASSTVTVLTGGAALTNVTGTGQVFGSVVANGLASAASTVDAGAKVGQSVTVATSSNDVNNSTTNDYVYDATTKVATLTTKVNNTTGPAVAVGNATANVAGIVGNTALPGGTGQGGDVTVTSTRGNATANITGRVVAGGTFSGNVTANANGSTTNTVSETVTQSLPGFGGDGRVVPTPALPVTTKLTSTTTTTATGGVATILVDTSAAFKAGGVGVASVIGLSSQFNSVNGTATASGLAGATVTVTAGSTIGRSANATSVGTNGVSTTASTFGTKLTVTTNSTTTNVGKAATITNDGTIGTAGFGDVVNAQGTSTATVTNSATGRVNGSVTANSLRVDVVSKVVDNDNNNTDPITRTIVTTTNNKAVGGVSTVTNAGTITGGVNVSGATGTVTNTGNIVGTTTFGASSGDFNTTTTQTSVGTTGGLPTANVALFKQTYTLNQSGISGGVNVTGATEGTPTIKTSDITATLNLNSGSITLGSITAQQTPNQFGSNATFLTTTTLNLNGAGYLGLDFYSNPVAPNPAAVAPIVPTFPARSPEANFTTAQGALFGLGASAGTTVSSANAGIGIRILGVTAVNKTGAGTFVIVGTPFNSTAAPATNPWSMDIGSLNVGTAAASGGELQLTHTGSAAQNLGIRGDINNVNGNLVLGRRAPTGIQTFGDTLGSAGPERILGITVNQTGNFTQAATGNLVVGVNPTLVRVSGTGTGGTTGGTEILGIPTVTTTQGLFTLPTSTGGAGAALQSTPSRLNVTGNVNLAGKVLVDVTRDSLYSDGDGYTLITYTGTGASTATVTTNLTSKFVAFTLNHNTTAKTIALTAARTAYNTGATNPNAKNAADGLNSALTAAITQIKTDATGGAGFSSTQAITRAQDVANIAAFLDWRGTDAQNAQIFDELSSGEIYSSLATVDQNAVFGQSLDILTSRRSAGASQAAALMGGDGGIGARLWFNPVGIFARYGTRTRSAAAGQSAIKANTYGGSMGLDIAYSDTGAFGFGVGYADHDIDARDTP